MTRLSIARALSSLTDHRGPHTCHPRHLDTVGAICAPWQKPVQEHNSIPFLLGSDIEVHYAGQQIRSLVLQCHLEFIRPLVWIVRAQVIRRPRREFLLEGVEKFMQERVV